jgi:hypothetical protein
MVSSNYTLHRVEIKPVGAALPSVRSLLVHLVLRRWKAMCRAAERPGRVIPYC